MTDATKIRRVIKMRVLVGFLDGWPTIVGAVDQVTEEDFDQEEWDRIRCVWKDMFTLNPGSYEWREITVSLPWDRILDLFIAPQIIGEIE